MWPLYSREHFHGMLQGKSRYSFSFKSLYLSNARASLLRITKTQNFGPPVDSPFPNFLMQAVAWLRRIHGTAGEVGPGPAWPLVQAIWVIGSYREGERRRGRLEGALSLSYFEFHRFL